jgi:hypothetical protein
MLVLNLKEKSTFSSNYLLLINAKFIFNIAFSSKSDGEMQEQKLIDQARSTGI